MSFVKHSRENLVARGSQPEVQELEQESNTETEQSPMEITVDRLIKAENEITIEEDLWRNSLDGSQFIKTGSDEGNKVSTIEGNNSNCYHVMNAKNSFCINPSGEF